MSNQYNKNTLTRKPVLSAGRKRCHTTGFLLLLVALVLSASGGNVRAEMIKVSSEEEKSWLYYALPLPHKIAITEKRIVNPADISISLQANASVIERNAAAILKDFIKAKTGVVPSGKGFEIVMGVLDRDGKVGGISLRNAGKLQGFPNSDQAYIIEPAGTNKLVIGALDPKGVFYGMHTLRQLLAREINSNSVAIPMALVEDWPDFGNRGFWNSCLTIYPELSMVKLNYAKNYRSSGTLAVQPPDRKDGQPVPLVIWGSKGLSKAKALYEDGRRYAFYNIPMMVHLNWWRKNKGYGKKLFSMYPDLAGKGDTAFQGSPKDRKKDLRFQVPCPSHPMLRKIIADTLMLYAEANIMEVSVWTTEYYSYCSCSNCIPAGAGPRQFILECRAIVGAAEDVRKKHPAFKVRVLGMPLMLKSGRSDIVAPALLETQGASWDREMPVIMKELPKDVILESVYTMYRRDQTGKRFVPMLDEYAAQGSKIIEYNVSPSMMYTFGILPKLRNRIINRYEAKWYGIIQWAMFSTKHEQTLRFASHDIAALAEWTWNANGRTVSEFIRAWVTVNGFNPPKPVVEWIEYAVKRDCVYYYFDRKSLRKNWLEDLVNMMKSGKPLATSFDLSLVDAAAFQDLEKMLQLSRAINQEFTLRTEYLIALYKQMAAIKDLIERANGQAAAPAMIKAVEQLDQAIDERSRAFAAMMELFGGAPRGYRAYSVIKSGGTPFEDQRLIIKNEMLPLVSKTAVP